MEKSKVSTYVFVVAFVVVLAAIIISAISTQRVQNPQKEASQLKPELPKGDGAGTVAFSYPYDQTSASKLAALKASGSDVVDNIVAAPYFDTEDTAVGVLKEQRPSKNITPGTTSVNFFLPSESRVCRKNRGSRAPECVDGAKTSSGGLIVDNWDSLRFTWQIIKANAQTKTINVVANPNEFEHCGNMTVDEGRCYTSGNRNTINESECLGYFANNNDVSNCYANPAKSKQPVEIIIPYPTGADVDGTNELLVDSVKIIGDQRFIRETPPTASTTLSNSFIYSNVLNSAGIEVTRPLIDSMGRSVWGYGMPIGSSGSEDGCYGGGGLPEDSCWEHATEWMDLSPSMIRSSSPNYHYDFLFRYFHKPVLTRTGSNSQLKFLVNRAYYSRGDDGYNGLLYPKKVTRASDKLNLQVKYRINDDGSKFVITCDNTNHNYADPVINDGAETYRICTISNIPANVQEGTEYRITGMAHGTDMHNQMYPIFVKVGTGTTTPTPTTPVVTTTPTPVVQASCSKVMTSKTQLELKQSGDTVNVNGEATVTVNRGASVTAYRVTRMDFTIAKPNADDFISIIPWASVSNLNQTGPVASGNNDVYTYRPVSDTTLSVPYAQLLGARTSGGLKVLLRVQTADGNLVSEDTTTCQSLNPGSH